MPDFKNDSGNWVKSFTVDGCRWRTLSGKRWQGLNYRCKLAGAYQNRRPSYLGCTNDFESFNSFVVWSKDQIGYDTPNWHLDKDLLLKGNKSYKEDYCIFLPSRINSLLTKANHNRGEFPIGVSWYKNSGKYKAACSNGYGKVIHLGYYNSVESAFYSYKSYKENLIKSVAEEFRDIIDDKAYKALLSYTVDIGD